MTKPKISRLEAQFEAVCDRLEKNIAVLEIEGSPKPIIIPLKALPSALREKDVLGVKMVIDKKKRDKILKETASLIEELENK